MIYFMRHGQSHANAQGVFAGPAYYAPLTEEGKQQARLEGERIKAANIVIDRIIASPLERAKETAQIIAHAIGFHPSRIEFDARFAEYDMGALSGQPKAEVTARQRTEAKDAEDPHAFQTRVMAALKEVSAKPGNTLIVSHAGVAGIIEATKRNSELRDFYDEGYPNAQIVREYPLTSRNS